MCKSITVVYISYQLSKKNTDFLLFSKSHLCTSICIIYITARTTTFIKANFEKSDDQTNIDKLKVAANIIEYHII